MKKIRIISKSVAILIACFTVLSMFFSCQKESDEKQITEFLIESPKATGVIDEAAKTIKVTVPEGTDVTELVPIIVVSPKATVDPESRDSQDFSKPVIYVVTAENGSTAMYTVTVVEGNNGGGEEEEGELLTNEWINRGNVTLAKGVYRVNTEWLSLKSPNKLTLSPGVVIKFVHTQDQFDVEKGATLTAVGTADSKILFTSINTSPKAGDWGCMHISGEGSVFEYCTFEYGGSDLGMMYTDCSITIKNCTFKNSLHAGLSLNNETVFVVPFANNQFINCADSEAVQDHPLKVTVFNSLLNFGDGNTFSNTAQNKGVWVVNNGGKYITKNITLKKMNVPYYFEGDSRIYNDYSPTTLTIEKGVQIIMLQYANIKVLKNGKIVAIGTDSERISISGKEDVKGYWDYITIEADALEGSIFENCDIKNGGRDKSLGAFFLDKTTKEQITIKQCLIAKTLGYGIYFSTNFGVFDADAVLENNTFSDCDMGDTNRP